MAAEWGPVKPAKTYEVVAEQLKAAILEGRFPPGSRLPSVRELSEQLSVGQGAVREALTALQAMNLVTMRHGEGTFVNQFDPHEIARSLPDAGLISRDDIRHLLELRKVLEAGAARLAAQRRGAEHVRLMEVALARMERDLASAALGEEADWAFHYEVARAAANPFFLSLMDAIAERIQALLRTSRQALYLIPGEPERLLAQHRAVFCAIAAGEPDAAARAMAEHLGHVEDALGLSRLSNSQGE
ncbi:MAG: FadR family transcriptional regulator [Alicyclobacillaceae bacterium]|nr:FadR family transcriptional regulator [Alicyclobacillaceae bacterium]